MRAAAVMVSALLSACTLEKEPTVLEGVVTVPWQAGAGGCASAGVDAVTVEIAGRSATAPCADGQLAIEAPAGRHPVDVWGLDAGGIARYAGSEVVTVAEGEATTMPTVILGALPASMDVTWYFDNGRLCGGNGVTDVEIVVFDNDFVVDTLLTPCDDGIERLSELLSGAYTVSVLGRDAAGAIGWSGSVDVTLDKGDLGFIEVPLAPL